jgi:hypothetical protein
MTDNVMELFTILRELEKLGEALQEQIALASH